jgi:hypothetical protein
MMMARLGAVASGRARFQEVFMDKAGGFFVVCAGLAGLLLMPPGLAAAAYDNEPGVPICKAKKVQKFPKITSDGAGGAIIAWADTRNGNEDIYAQRVSADGTVQWVADGVAVCADAGSQGNPALVPDGAGGAIVAWADYRKGRRGCATYVQRMSADGRALWAPEGVALTASAGDQWNLALVPDGEGGAVVVWEDYRNGRTSDIFAQRVSATGTPQWSAAGVALCTAPWTQGSVRLAPDGAGGAIVAWVDSRRPGYEQDIYAQRIAADGTVRWDSNGVALCAAAGWKCCPIVVPDDAGGAIVAWDDWRNRNQNVYAQRVSATGLLRWGADGVALWTDSCRMATHGIVADGAGGAISRRDVESHGNCTVRVQQISGDATPRWSGDGVVLCSAAGSITGTMIADAAGGAIVAWPGIRGGGRLWDIYAQRISADGGVQWAADGVAVCTRAGDPFPPVFVSDGAGGAILTWSDYDFRRHGDIYAQGVKATGQLWPKRAAPAPAKGRGRDR